MVTAAAILLVFLPLLALIGLALLTQDLHAYGVAIDPERMRFFLDHVQFLDVSTLPAFRQPMYLLADFALGAGYPIDGLASPAVMQIAYIGAYRDRTASL